MPEGFDFPHRTDVWLPVVPILANAGNGRIQAPLESVGVLFVVGRLREGVTPAMAFEELNRLVKLGPRFSDSSSDMCIPKVPFRVLTVD